MPLLQFTDKGIFCEQAGVYIDPWRKVDRAIITHAHSDHARSGMKHYLCHTLTAPLLQARLSSGISVETKEYGEPFIINGVKFSLHPAGHVVGAAQVRVEYQGDVWVASGDYKLQDDGLATPFEPVPCRVFITECTFGLPIYQWRPQQEVFTDINNWWKQNQQDGKVSLLMGYSLGKAQRLIKNVDHGLGKIYTHTAVENMNKVLRDHGVSLPETTLLKPEIDKKELEGALIVAPPGAAAAKWLSKIKNLSTGYASGWMTLRGARRRETIDRGFVLSDHADWNELNTAVKECGAESVITTHGYTSVFARWLNEQGIDAYEEHTEFEGELTDSGEEASREG